MWKIGCASDAGLALQDMRHIAEATEKLRAQSKAAHRDTGDMVAEALGSAASKQHSEVESSFCEYLEASNAPQEIVESSMQACRHSVSHS